MASSSGTGHDAAAKRGWSNLEVVLTLGDEDLEKVERGAREASGDGMDWTPAMWIEWLIYQYAPPEEADSDV